MEQARLERAVEQAWVVTANALMDGGVRYLTPTRAWSPSLQQAWSGPADAADALLGWARTDEAVVCDPYVVDVDRVDGALVPRSTREIIRAEGPAPTLVRLGYAPPGYTPTGISPHVVRVGAPPPAVSAPDRIRAVG